MAFRNIWRWEVDAYLRSGWSCVSYAGWWSLRAVASRPLHCAAGDEASPR